MTLLYTPQYNGTVERKYRVVVEKIRCLLKSSGLRIALWAEATAAAVYLINISLMKVIYNSTPYELWTGVKTNVKHLKVFGCLAFTQVPSQKRMKLESKSEMEIFVGYCLQTKTYKVYNPITCKMVLNCDVVFREDEHGDWKTMINTPT